MRLVACFVVLWALIIGAVAQQQILVPTRPPGDNSNAAASTAFVNNAVAPITNQAAGTVLCREVGAGVGSPLNCNSPIIDVTDFPYSGDPSGTNDSTSAIANAIAALPATGGTVRICGNFKVSSTVNLGNGSASAVSTRYGVQLLGCGLPPNVFGFTGYPTAAVSRIFWSGVGTGPVIKIAGPLQGWAITNLLIDGSGIANTCIDIVSGQFGGIYNSGTAGCLTRGIVSDTVVVSGVPVTNSLNNYIENVSISLPPAATSGLCVVLGGSATQNTEFTHLKNVSCVTGASTQQGFYFQVACGNELDGWSVAGSATVSIAFDYSVTNSQPCNNVINNGQPNGTGTGWITNSGTTPSTTASPNYLTNLITTDGAQYPNPGLANLVTDQGDFATILASGAAFWNPTFFGNAGNAIVYRRNREFVGAAQQVSSDIRSSPQLPTVPGWLDTLFNQSIVGESQFASGSAIGSLGLTGYSRCSDFRTIFGSSSGGCQGNTGIGVNDDSTGAAIAAGTVGIGIQRSGAVGISLGTQNDVNNAATTVDITPFSGIPAGATVATLSTGGAYTALSSNNISAGWAVARGRTGGPQARKGGVCQDAALDTTVGAGGDGVCLEMARNQSIRWQNNGGTTDGEITANANGIQFPTDQAWANFTPSPTCGTATFTVNSAKFKTLGKTTFIELNITITAIGTCTNVISFTYPNTPNSAAVLAGILVVNSVVVMCRAFALSATGQCVQNAGANFAASQIVASGVYENQ